MSNDPLIAQLCAIHHATRKHPVGKHSACVLCVEIAQLRAATGIRALTEEGK